MRGFYKISFLLFILIFTSYLLLSQTYYHKLYTVKDGLSQTQVISLMQDDKGYLWIGTNGGGVNIFDGKTFRNITSEDGLAGNIVFSIISDKKGNIWFGTDQGVSKYDGKEFTNYTEDNGLPHKYVYSLLFRKNGDLVIGTYKGVAILNKDSIKLLDGNDNLNNTTVYSILETDENELWFGTGNKGVIGLVGEKFVEYTVEDGLFHNQIWNLNKDSDNRLWILTSNGLNYITRNKVFEADPGRTYMSSLKFDDGTMLFVQYNGWVVTYDGTKKIKDNLFIKTKIRKVIKDFEGNLWLGTEKGLIKYPENKFINYDESFNLHHNNVFAMTEISTGDYWVGATADGASLMKINSSTNSSKFKNYPHIQDSINTLPHSSVFSIIENADSNIWFATWGGISVFNPKTKIFTNYTNDSTTKLFNYNVNITSKIINTIYLDSKGIIWIGTDNGITQYYDSTFHNFNNEHEILKKEKVLNIFEDITKNIWFASANGIYKYNGYKVNHYGKREGFINDIVNTIVQDREKYYWLATKRGIYRFDGINFNNISKENGLSSNNIYLLGYDNNKLYIGTNKGLDILNTLLYNKKDSLSIKHFGELEGFIGLECNRNAFMKSKDGRLWFGTVSGITIYDPKIDNFNSIPPNTFITNIKLDFNDIDWGKYADTIDSKTDLPVNLILPYNKNHLTFNFIGLSLTISEKVKYKYMMEGLDDNWSPALFKDEADYPALPPGDYIFKVKACNNDGIWNESSTIFKFTINPPFWRTIWFYIVSSILILLIIYLFIKRREANLKREKRILEEKVVERTVEVVRQKEIVEQKNKDITDSINYAKNIQEALLPAIKDFENIFPSSFIFYRPRDIVSGDFYWMSQKNNRTFFAASDCTGHGVPGAFMSMLGIAFLDEIVNMNPNIMADELLNQLRDNVIVSLHQSGGDGENRDGMDISLCIVDWNRKQLQYVGANNSMYLIRDSKIIEYKSDKMPIGFHIRKSNFNNNIIDIIYGDIIYLFSDGYADQFGGSKNKKFKYKKFKELLLEIHQKPMPEQKEIISKVITEWQGENEQVDDILVIGVNLRV